jgi:hypothetical protein
MRTVLSNETNDVTLPLPTEVEGQLQTSRMRVSACSALPRVHRITRSSA